MPKSLTYTAMPVFLVTSAAWVIGLSTQRLLMSEVWLYVGIFLLPALAVCACSWLIFQNIIWRKAIGAILLLPCLAVWLLSLLLVANGFKIH